MTADHKRRLARLEAASPEQPLRWRQVVMKPGDPEPAAEPGEALILERIVAPRHEHDPKRSDCICLTCWEERDSRVSARKLTPSSAIGRFRIGGGPAPTSAMGG
jgi:hypothetical protein